MDNRFTKKRIANMLAYDWIKIVALICAIVFVWILAYTVGAPSLSTGQSFGVFYYNGDSVFSYKHGPKDFGEKLKKAGAFSYDVLDFNMREIGNSQVEELLMLSATVAEPDVMITVDLPSKIEEGTSEFRDFVDGYAEVLYDYDSLIVEAKAYCTSNKLVYKTADGEYLLDEKEIRELFAIRMQKDPRFKEKGGEKYLQGVQGEIQRIKDIWNNAVMLENCLEEHSEIRLNYAQYDQAKKVAPDQYTGEEFLNKESKTYAIDLGKLSNGEIKVTEEFYYSLKNENGEIAGRSADGIVLCVYNFKDAQPHLQFETLSFVNAVIKRYSNFLNANCEGLIK